MATGVAVAPAPRKGRKQKNNGSGKKKSKRAKKVAKYVRAFQNNIHLTLANARQNLTNEEMNNAYAEISGMLSPEQKHKGSSSDSDSSSNSE